MTDPTVTDSTVSDPTMTGASVPAPLVGLVFVSHSTEIASGLVALARQMAPNVALIGAGGTDDGGIGTSFDTITAGIIQADRGSGVVVLCDLGSAILTAETAVEFLDEDVRGRVRIADAPLVEGGVAAAVTAETGGDLSAVVAAAESAAGGDADRLAAPSPTGTPGPVTRTVTLKNRDGLHARPAADFVKLASTFDVPFTVNGKDAHSLLGIMSLGLTRGMSVEIAGPDENSRAAIDALAELIESGFGEE
jgi:PTS hybrid protein